MENKSFTLLNFLEIITNQQNELYKKTLICVELIKKASDFEKNKLLNEMFIINGQMQMCNILFNELKKLTNSHSNFHNHNKPH